jgi:Ulp1 family protease
MKLENLIELGIEEELAKKVIEQVEAKEAETLKGFIPKSRFDEVNNEKNALKTTLSERDKQLEELGKSSGDIETLKTEIIKLQGDNKSAMEAHSKEVHKLKTQSAVATALTRAKAKNIKAVTALLTGLDDAKFNDDDTIKGLADQIASLQKDDASSFLFDMEQGKDVKGAKPADSGDSKPDATPDIAKMNYEEIAVYMAKNPNVKL